MYSTAMADQPPSRRERLRAQTTAEIKATALSLLSSGGPDAITLRAIARQMGMTANAIYGYFPTRDDLITTLIGEVYSSLVDAVEQKRDARRAEGPAGEILGWAEGFREWSMSNPEGFRLIYGDPVPGYQAPESSAASQAAYRACIGLTGLAADVRRAAGPQTTVEFQWDDFDPTLIEKVRTAYPDLAASTVAFALQLWGRLHGLVSLEIYGHLRHQIADPAKLYRDELSQLIRSTGLTPPS